MGRTLFLFQCVGTLSMLIVTLATSPALQAQPTSTFTELWAIEGQDSELVLPRFITVTESCEVWLTDTGSGVWRWNCETSKPIAVGRVGAGPGEYRAPVMLFASRDNSKILLWDRRLQRAMTFSEQGDYLDMETLRLPEVAFGRVIGMSTDASGEVRYAWTSILPTATNGGAQRSHVLALKKDGTLSDSILSLSGFGSVFWRDGMTSSRFDQPLQRRPFVVFLKSGGFVAANNGAPAVTRYDGRGRPLGSTTLNLPKPGAVTERDRTAYKDSTRRVLEHEMEGLRYGESLRDRFRKAVDRNLPRVVEFPESRQWFDNLLVDESAQVVWVQLPGFDSTYTRTWLIMGLGDGSVQRRVKVPHKGAVVSAALDASGALYTVEQSQDFVPRVAKYGGK